MDWVRLSMGVDKAEDLLLRTVVNDHIDRVMAACDRNVSLAARVLGMSRRGLQRKLGGRRKKRGRKKSG
jgi:ActR/RegA family two-component response regulator